MNERQIFMNKKELISRVASAMRERGQKKSVKMPSRTFKISDNDGNEKSFVVKTSNKEVLFTVDDVGAVIDTCIYVIEEALKNGEETSVHGFGTLGLNLRKQRNTIHPTTGEPVFIEEHLTPKFYPGNNLKLCAKLYNASQQNSDGDK